MGNHGRHASRPNRAAAIAAIPPAGCIPFRLPNRLRRGRETLRPADADIGGNRVTQPTLRVSPVSWQPCSPAAFRFPAPCTCSAARRPPRAAQALGRDPRRRDRRHLAGRRPGPAPRGLLHHLRRHGPRPARPAASSMLCLGRSPNSAVASRTSRAGQGRDGLSLRAGRPGDRVLDLPADVLHPAVLRASSPSSARPAALTRGILFASDAGDALRPVCRRCGAVIVVMLRRAMPPKPAAASWSGRSLARADAWARSSPISPWCASRRMLGTLLGAAFRWSPP